MVAASLLLWRISQPRDGLDQAVTMGLSKQTIGQDTGLCDQNSDSCGWKSLHNCYAPLSLRRCFARVCASRACGGGGALEIAPQLLSDTERHGGGGFSA